MRSSIRNPSSSSKRTARSRRSGSSTEDRLRDRADDPGLEIGPSVVRIVVRAGTDVDGDRVEREVARREIGVDPSPSGVKSTVSSTPSATTRQAPCRSESGNTEPPKRRAKRFAASRGSAQATSRSSTGRWRSSSRTAPPTTHASSSPRISRRRSSIDGDPPGARPERVFRPVAISYAIVPATRACSSMSMPSPTSVTGVPASSRPVELHGERVHRDRPDDAATRALDEHLGSRHVATEAVCIPDRDDADPRRAIGDEAPPVARALPRLELLHERDVRLPAQRRLETVVGGIGAERRDAVERDPAPNRVEPRLGDSAASPRCSRDGA